jgi:hypothetical protein
MPLLGYVHCRMLDKLATKRTSEDTVQSSLSATMGVMIESVMEKCAYLLGLASQWNKAIFFADQQTISNMLASAIPQRILTKMTKSKIVKHMVDVWNILRILLPLVKLGRAEEHNAIEKSCCRDLAEADNEDQNAKSLKISP